jgi:uncharacterized membrane protein
VAVAVQATVQGAVTRTVPVCVQVFPSTLAVRTQVKLPAEAYVWLGFCSVELAPSPKAHAKAVVPVQWVAVAVAVKATTRGATPAVGIALAAHVSAHGSLTATVPVCVQVWSSAVTVSVQAKLPAVAYVWPGFCSEDVAPSPNAHANAGAPVQWVAVAVAWKLAGIPATPEPGAVAEHVSAQGSPMVMVPPLVHVFPSAVTISVQL